MIKVFEATHFSTGLIIDLINCFSLLNSFIYLFKAHTSFRPCWIQTLISCIYWITPQRRLVSIFIFRRCYGNEMKSHQMEKVSILSTMIASTFITTIINFNIYIYVDIFKNLHNIWKFSLFFFKITSLYL